ncbi:uncharacterized protein BYT42DRAFT_3676 [Radiomyces spectabilis]|uniref:uncharacterized protein n=1 Tax=Radiomyces spectabilis TaxID=64574 RepID=UPI00221E42F9|nr:uncharacterized protein BYT42DRAFT_3676 [Radiomyces spectabilis]KAI8393362.1 hypothetical protein BYT42DRAFT_3676 [Radiomyces spectabilis]
MESLVEASSQELATQIHPDRAVQSSLNRWHDQTLQCRQRIEETAAGVVKTRAETDEVQAAVQLLRDKMQQLQETFDEIDQIEAIVNTVKETYNEVAASVEAVEKAVAASHRTKPLFQLPIATRSATPDIPVQPYFPPPPPVQIYHTDDLFNSSNKPA